MKKLVKIFTIAYGPGRGGCPSLTVSLTVKYPGFFDDIPNQQLDFLTLHENNTFHGESCLQLFNKEILARIFELSGFDIMWAISVDFATQLNCLLAENINKL